VPIAGPLDDGIDSFASNANNMGVAVDANTVDVVSCGSFSSYYIVVGAINASQRDSNMFVRRTRGVSGDDGYIMKVGQDGTVKWVTQAGGECCEGLAPRAAGH
jgi:hypothetical protein